MRQKRQVLHMVVTTAPQAIIIDKLAPQLEKPVHRVPKEQKIAAGGQKNALNESMTSIVLQELQTGHRKISKAVY